MSQENVDLTYRVHDAFNRRDLPAFLALMDDEVEAQSRLAAVEGGYHGHHGVRTWWADATRVIDLRTQVDDVRDLGDATVVRVRTQGRGVGSSATFEQTVWQGLQWRGGKITRWHTLATEAEALEAVGLSE